MQVSVESVIAMGYTACYLYSGRPGKVTVPGGPPVLAFMEPNVAALHIYLIDSRNLHAAKQPLGPMEDMVHSLIRRGLLVGLWATSFSGDDSSSSEIRRARFSAVLNLPARST